MKNILITGLNIENFKGCRALNFSPCQHVTEVQGANGTGKSTIVDAYLWVLFGRNAQGQTEGAKGFAIKPMSEDGNPIHKLRTSVTLLLSIDGAERKLQKTYEEKWSKPRGQKEEILSSHETNYYVDEVPVKAKDYEIKVSEICDSTQFTLLSQPGAFMNLKWDARREILTSMVGIPLIDEVAQHNESHKELIARLGDKSLEEFRIQRAYEKKNVKKELDACAPKIQALTATIRKTASGITDAKLLKVELDELTNRLHDITKTGNADIKKQLQEKKEQHKILTDSLTKEIESNQATLDIKIQNIQMMIDRKQSEYNKDYESANALKRNYTSAINEKEQSKVVLNRQLDKVNTNLENLRAKYKQITSRQYEGESYGVCPLSGEACETARMLGEKKYREGRERFEMQRQQDIDANVAEGKAVAKEKVELLDQLAKIDDSIASTQIAISDLDMKFAQLAEDKKKLDDIRFNGEITIKATSEEIRNIVSSTNPDLVGKIKKLEDEINALNIACSSDMNERDKEVETIRLNMASLNSDISIINTNNVALQHISSIEVEEKRLAELLCKIENDEYFAEEIIHAQMDELESRVNKVFGHGIRFSMYETQLNGGESPACTLKVDGTPYNDLNTAGKMHADLYIIKAMQGYFDTCVPLFIDNAESVSYLPETDAQTITLTVNSESRNLDIKHIMKSN
ncbi:MAG: AAA family ATPase [Marinilabiliaceae bacterium]|nr:AAA family ATPase [Marinilabiliaceae bacterium]